MAMLSKPKAFSMTQPIDESPLQQIGNCNLPPFITSQHTQPRKSIKQKIFKAISADTLLLPITKGNPFFPKSPSLLLQKQFAFSPDLHLLSFKEDFHFRQPFLFMLLLWYLFLLSKCFRDGSKTKNQKPFLLNPKP
jgi:hypothetical protein